LIFWPDKGLVSMHKGEEIKTETGLAIGKIVPVQYGKAILSGQIAVY